MVTGTTIIRNGVLGAYPFVESILQVLPYVDEYIVVYDLGSSDGTSEILKMLSKKYSKVKLINYFWPLSLGPEVISHVTNISFEECKPGWIIHNQADEVYTDQALKSILERLDKDSYYAYVVNRVQIGPNFQTFYMGESGCSLCRVGIKGLITSVGDGQSIAVQEDNWDHLDHTTNYHMFDVTRAFVGNFPGRSLAQEQIWWMNPNRNAGGWFGKTPDEWQKQVDIWENNGFDREYLLSTSPYQDLLPDSLKFWIGKPYWYPREDYLI